VRWALIAHVEAQGGDGRGVRGQACTRLLQANLLLILQWTHGGDRSPGNAGVGPITATALVAAVGEAKEFKNGRHLSAWLGLVPRQYSSGGKSHLKGISKRGDTYLRTLLIHGARSVLRDAVGKTDVQSRWLQELIARRGYNRAAVALAEADAMAMTGHRNYETFMGYYRAEEPLNREAGWMLDEDTVAD
jgi:hypothetical protein